METSDERWTIAELGEQVASALATDYDAPENGQVRAVPNQRTIRYYTTLGLLDRPIEMRGRTALYNRLHLSQLVAIKRLQAEGNTLANIQRDLAGAKPDDIARIARLDVVAPTLRAAPTRTAFWLDEPAAPGPPAPPRPTPPRRRARPHPTPAPAPAPTPTPTSPSPSPSPNPTHAGIELAPGLILQLDTRVFPRSPDPAALQRAAETLLAALRSDKPNPPA